jgi:hypothetical protein
MRPDLFIPVRDRRARKRYLTLKNSAIVAAAVIAIFAVITLYANRRHATTGEYGRLLRRQVAQPEVTASRPVDVVTEGPVEDLNAPDPMLLVPAAREQALGTNLTVAKPQAAVAVAAPSPAPVAVAAAMASSGAPAGEGGHVAIVGDQNGVAIVRTEGDNTPKLRGGFGRKE